MNRAMRCLVLLISVNVRVGFGSEWTYEGDHGPDQWPGVCTIGSAQSPVNIQTSEAISKTVNDIVLKDYNHQFQRFMLTNNGHSVKISFPNDVVPQISEAELPGTFNLLQGHFHWAQDNKVGSEHNLDGHPYPLELHLVHFNAKYKDVFEALTKKDGLAVIGIFFEISSQDNPFLQPIASNLKHVVEGGTNANFTEIFTMKNLIPGDFSQMFRYKGSLTTPGCNEVVTWTIINKIAKVSQQQMEEFRKLTNKEEEVIHFNYRPLQQLNGRAIYHLYAKSSHTSSHVNVMGIVSNRQLTGQVAADSNEDQKGDNSSSLRSDISGLMSLAVIGIIWVLEAGFLMTDVGELTYEERKTGGINSLIMRYWLTLSTSCVLYLSVGSAISWGQGQFIGTTNFLLIGGNENDVKKVLFSLTQTIVTVNIVCQGLGSYVNNRGHLFICLLIAGFFSPIQQHWTQQKEGVFTTRGYLDNIGSGTAHLFAGIVLMIASKFLGSRIQEETINMSAQKKKGQYVIGRSLVLVGLICQVIIGPILRSDDTLRTTSVAVNVIFSLSLTVAIHITLAKLFKQSGYFEEVTNLLVFMTVSVGAALDLYPIWLVAIITPILVFVFIIIRTLIGRWKMSSGPWLMAWVHTLGGFLGPVVASLVRSDGNGCLYSPSPKAAIWLGWTVVCNVIIICLGIAFSVILLTVLVKLHWLVPNEKELDDFGGEQEAGATPAARKECNLSGSETEEAKPLNDI